MKSTGRRESEVQAGIMAYLSTRSDFYCWRANTSAGIAQSGQFMRSGMPGAADIQGVLAPIGHFVGIEVKRESGGKLSDDQKRWGENVARHGGIYIVARSIADVEDALPNTGVKVTKLTKQRVYSKGPSDLCTCTKEFLCPLCSRALTSP